MKWLLIPIITTIIGSTNSSNIATCSIFNYSNIPMCSENINYYTANSLFNSKEDCMKTLQTMYNYTDGVCVEAYGFEKSLAPTYVPY